MEIYSCGIEVETKIGQIIGVITCASIRFDKLTYEISYFYQGEYKTVWLNEAEFITSEKEKQVVGFLK